MTTMKPLSEQRHEVMRHWDKQLTQAIRLGLPVERIAYLRSKFESAQQQWQKAEQIAQREEQGR